MSIFYDWYECPKTSEQQDEPITLYPRIAHAGTTTTPQLQRYIEASCSLTKGDVAAVLASLSHYVARELSNGKSIKLDGIGILTPVLGSTETVTPDTRRKSTKVRLKSIRFRADKQLLKEMGAIRVEPLGMHNPLRTRLSDDEIEQAIRTYLSRASYLRRSTLQELCSLSRTTAIRHLNRLCQAGVLINHGLPNQPLYGLKESTE
ncbi:MAG: HU family DNA-binding protein [Bacteroides sp.]|nr:HU family DNA-binding protein [Bacteroides sp.]